MSKSIQWSPTSYLLELKEDFVPEMVQPIIYERKEKGMDTYIEKRQLSKKICKFSLWTEFKILVTASLLTVNLNISSNIEVYP